MPYTQKFRKLLKATSESYGKKKGTSIAFAIAHKRNIQIDLGGKRK